MADKRYSKREAINRILRVFEGKALPNDYLNTITGEVLSEDEAISDLAELVAGSLPGESFTMPSGADLAAYTATEQEARAGTEDAKFITPATLDGTCLWGEIYAYTGTSSMVGLTQNVFTMITGAFQNQKSQSNGYIVNSPTADKITVNAVGSYFLDWQMSFIGSAAVEYRVAPHMNSGTVYQAVSVVKPYVSGSSVMIGGHGIINVTATNTQIDLRVSPSATGWLKFVAGQLTVRRIAHNE